MSTTETEIGGRVQIVREFHTILERQREGDGRTLIGLCVPYNVPTLVADDAMGQAYMEEFVPGVFDRNLKAPHRVLLRAEHQAGIQGVIGRAVELESRSDGFYGAFKVYANADGDKALQLYEDGVFDSFSVGAEIFKSQRASSGVVQRISGHLDHTGVCREGAYVQAKVLALREADQGRQSERQDVSLQPVPFDPAFAAQLARYVDLPLDLRMLNRAFTDQPWDGSSSRWPDADAYCRSCLIDDNTPGSEKTKALCHLPVREPNGDVNVHAVQAALARVDQVQTSDANKAAARRKLEAMMADAQGMMA